MQNVKTSAQTLCRGIKNSLADHGFPRNSRAAGGEVNGVTSSYGSTGFSVLRTKDDVLLWHVVISGRPHLKYQEYFCSFAKQQVREPVNANVIEDDIGRVVSQALGVPFLYAYCCGHQRVWDDDVSYYVVTPLISDLENIPRSGFSNPYPSRMPSTFEVPDF